MKDDICTAKARLCFFVLFETEMPHVASDDFCVNMVRFGQ